jgi:hypothetical protein
MNVHSPLEPWQTGYLIALFKAIVLIDPAFAEKVDLDTK